MTTDTESSSPTTSSPSPPPTVGYKRTALEAAKLGENIDGKVFVVTGCYSGIGVETVKALLDQGGKVVLGGRNPQQLEDFAATMKSTYNDNTRVDSAVLDLGDLESVQKFAQYILAKTEIYHDVCVICNAGVMNTPPGLTKSGFESQMGVNVVGHYLLCKL